jgi:nicotinamide-nucleotide amidase
MTAYLLTVGDEILIGQITDTNSTWMAQELNLQGIRIAGKASVSDTKEAIIRGLKDAFEQADLILVTGGLGATKDDITKKTIAEYFNTEMVWHQETYNRLEGFFTKAGRTVSEMNRNSCYMPADAVILNNDRGLAPAMWFSVSSKILVSLPGVPFEMMHLMKHKVLPKLREVAAQSEHPNLALSPIVHRTVLTAGEGETMLAERLSDFEDQLPENVKLAYLPAISQVRLRLTATGDSEPKLNTQIEALKDKLVAIVGRSVFGYETEVLSSNIGKQLIEKDMTIGLAESCSGGYLSHLFTLEAGSSKYFKGAVVAYDNELKVKLLKVKIRTLKKYGAVSEETAIEMALGAKKLLNTSLALSITGIAGPTGGSPEKPVGLVWLAITDGVNTKTHKFTMDRGRAKTIEYAANIGLNLIRRFL